MDSIPIDLLHAYHDEERRIFSRMVFILGLEPNLSMKIIAFWLWLEENKCKDVVQRLNSLDDRYLLRVCDVAKSFLDSLQLSYSSMDHAYPSEGHFKQAFRDVAICGINYYLDNVCHKVLLDIRKQVHQSYIEKLVEEMGRVHFGSEFVRKTGCSHIRIENFTDGSRIKEGNSYMMRKELTPLDLNKIKSRNRFFDNMRNSFQTNDDFLRCEDLVQYHSTTKDVANSSLSSNVSSSTNRKIPRDERTLFVTFSNGHPLSEEQLQAFFMRHFGDVERVYAPERADNKPPLYAHVTFCSPATLVRVLNGNGNVKVKFVIEGKQLWARRFVPKNEYKQHRK
ncbi:uncharacterized protein LOC122013868 [Zingiber officinale]|uniref:uncharacterized protein LOC122013868 n=1 Tax=Zingiber officinale TaxID=94328 RepID=UPI001C4A9B41|nr:uncharacterized protein LOC122013868 [Zingiber officinale]